MSPVFNYEQISELLKIFFQRYGYNPVNTSNVITNLTFNSELNYEDQPIPDDSFVIQKCSRIDDIKHADKLCTLPLFHIFACSETLSSDGIIDFLIIV